MLDAQPQNTDGHSFRISCDRACDRQMWQAAVTELVTERCNLAGDRQLRETAVAQLPGMLLETRLEPSIAASMFGGASLRNRTLLRFFARTHHPWPQDPTARSGSPETQRAGAWAFRNGQAATSTVQLLQAKPVAAFVVAA